MAWTILIQLLVALFPCCLSLWLSSNNFSKIVLLPLHTVVGMYSCILLLLAGRIFFFFFFFFCNVLIRRHCLILSRYIFTETGSNLLIHFFELHSLFQLRFFFSISFNIFFGLFLLSEQFCLS